MKLLEFSLCLDLIPLYSMFVRLGADREQVPRPWSIVSAGGDNSTWSCYSPDKEADSLCMLV